MHSGITFSQIGLSSCSGCVPHDFQTTVHEVLPTLHADSLSINPDSIALPPAFLPCRENYRGSMPFTDCTRLAATLVSTVLTLSIPNQVSTSKHCKLLQAVILHLKPWLKTSDFSSGMVTYMNPSFSPSRLAFTPKPLMYMSSHRYAVFRSACTTGQGQTHCWRSVLQPRTSPI